MIFSRRTSGVLLHPTSLPGRYGIGDLGEQAYRFVDFLAESLQQIWQVLPLGPTGYGNSPYLSYSAFAGNPLLINLEWLVAEGLIGQDELDALPTFERDRVNYDLVIETKLPLIKKASQRFSTQASPERKQEFETFCQNHAYWLDDYSLFMAIKAAHNGASWYEWDEAIAKREPVALKEWRSRLAEDIFYYKYVQSEFFRQWSTLRSYANNKGIQIFGDLPIYVAHDSADVWAHRDIFVLNIKNNRPATMAGVPPDYFSATGQLWGNPVYNWKQLEENKFKWWIQRIEGMLDYVDIIRIDHFRGLAAFWGVPGNAKVATKGQWVKAKGDEFFELLTEQLGHLPIVAEDLGVITPDVEALRDKYGLPGMKVLHFAFDSDRMNPFLPYNYTDRNCFVYTGTHDNSTTVGWYNARSPEDKQRVLDYLGCIGDEGINWRMIRLALGSVANHAIIPLQDLLGLGDEAKMNTPGTSAGNWTWRYIPEQLNWEVRHHLGHLTYVYGRSPY